MKCKNIAVCMSVIATSGCLGAGSNFVAQTPCLAGSSTPDCLQVTGGIDDFGLPTTTAVTNFAPAILHIAALLGAATVAGLGASVGGGTNGTNSTN